MPNVYGTFNENKLTIRRTTNGRITAEVGLRLPIGNRPIEVFTDESDCVHVIVASPSGRRQMEVVYNRFGGVQRRLPLHG